MVLNTSLTYFKCFELVVLCATFSELVDLNNWGIHSLFAGPWDAIGVYNEMEKPIYSKMTNNHIINVKVQEMVICTKEDSYI